MHRDKLEIQFPFLNNNNQIPVFPNWVFLEILWHNLSVQTDKWTIQKSAKASLDLHMNEAQVLHSFTQSLKKHMSLLHQKEYREHLAKSSSSIIIVKYFPKLCFLKQPTQRAALCQFFSNKDLKINTLQNWHRKNIWPKSHVEAPKMYTVSYI